ncbi:MAG: glutamate--tRNA ligase [Bacilli bacterium]|jgi:glutamyl-tRNA synthetase
MDNKLLAELLFPNIEYKPSYFEEKYPNRKLGGKAMVTRFAPSPTGFVHMGSLYAAFINRLLADQSNGLFYLRIEDTDHKREVDGGIDKIREALNYFKITLDESPFNEGLYGPYIQSKRKVIYQVYVKDLVRRGLAYPCFCTEGELEQTREDQTRQKVITGYYGNWAKCRNLSLDEIKEHIEKGDTYVIRLRTPRSNGEKALCSDMIKGLVSFPANDIDIVLLKADGLPTYHLAHVIDDHLMHTTHVIRGDEWLSSMPIHIQLTSLLNFELPKYVHISPLTKKEGNSIRKLSKRKDPELAISYYQELGIPVEAIKIYFATLINSNFEQWYSENANDDIKNFTFSFDKMPVGGTLFDIDKLTNICKKYFSLKDNIDLYNEALDYYKQYDEEFYNILKNNKEYALKVLNIEKNGKRVRKDIGCYNDIKKETSYMFDELFYNSNPYTDIAGEYNVEVLEEYLKGYINLDNEENWYNGIKELAVKSGYASDVKSYKQNPGNYKGHVGHICEMIRVALTGRKQTPNLFEIQNILGKSRIEGRIANFKQVLLKK